MWRTIAEGKTLNNLRATVKDQDIPKGTPIRFELDLKLPVARAFDLAGAEFLFKGNMPDNVKLIDVHSYGNSIVIIEAESDGVWILPIIAFLGTNWFRMGLLALGITLSLGFLVTAIKVKSPLPVIKETRNVILAISAVLALILVGYFLIRRS